MKRRHFLISALVAPAAALLGRKPEPEVEVFKSSGTWTTPDVKPTTVVVTGWGGAGGRGGHA